MQPTFERPRLKSMQRAEYPDKDVLSQVFGVVRIPRQPIRQPIDPSAVIAYQLFPRRRRPLRQVQACDVAGAGGCQASGSGAGHCAIEFDLPTTSVHAGQVQPERLIVACHPGNALNEPWQ